MSRWLTKFSAGFSESRPDNPDILPSVSALSGVSLENQAEIQAGDWITWDYGGPAQVESFGTDQEGTVWIFVSWLGWQAAVNAKYVTKVR